MFDLGLWHMIACGHCQQRRVQGGSNTAGWSVAVSLTMFVVSVTCAMVYFRAFQSDDGGMGDGSVEDGATETEGDAEAMLFDEGPQSNVTDQEQTSIAAIKTVLDYYADEDDPDFRFLYGYLVELLVSLFVYTPIVQLVLFSGALGCCGRVPFLGGRPRSLRNDDEVLVEV